MLYELLTGTTPFDRKRLDTAGCDEMRRIIQEEDPPKPSLRLTTIDKFRVPTLADSEPAPRPIEGAGDQTQSKQDSIPSDLDWFVMKAMEKDRVRRTNQQQPWRLICGVSWRRNRLRRGRHCNFID